MIAPSETGGAHPIVYAPRERPIFSVGNKVRISNRRPVGHYRVPTYLRGKKAEVERVIEPTAVDNEEEGFGRNAGSRRHYYRVVIPMMEIWTDYRSSQDGLRIEIFETWLERI